MCWVLLGPGDMKVNRTQYLDLRPQSSDTCRNQTHWPHLMAVSLPSISQLRISSALASDEQEAPKQSILPLSSEFATKPVPYFSLSAERF